MRNDMGELMMASPKLDENSFTYPITPDTLRVLDALSDALASQQITARAIWIDQQNRLTFAEKGLIVEYVERRELWKQSGRSSLNDWIESRCPYSKSSWHDARRRWKELADVPAEDKIQMTRGNLIQMKKVPESLRKDAEVLAAAKECRESNDFIDRVNAKYPDLHLEPLRPVAQRLEETDARIVDEALELAIHLGKAKSKAEAHRELAEFYIDGNRDAYDRMVLDETA